VFENLMHLYNKASLRGCFSELDGRKAVGTDGMDKAMYGAEFAIHFFKPDKAGEQFCLEPIALIGHDGFLMGGVR